MCTYTVVLEKYSDGERKDSAQSFEAKHHVWPEEEDKNPFVRFLNEDGDLVAAFRSHIVNEIYRSDDE